LSEEADDPLGEARAEEDTRVEVEEGSTDELLSTVEEEDAVDTTCQTGVEESAEESAEDGTCEIEEEDCTDEDDTRAEVEVGRGGGVTIS